MTPEVKKTYPHLTVITKPHSDPTIGCDLTGKKCPHVCEATQSLSGPQSEVISVLPATDSSPTCAECPLARLKHLFIH